MQFRPIQMLTFPAKATAPPPTAQRTAAAPVTPPAPPPATGRQALVEGAQNLLKHIPGEASGFYLIAVDAFVTPSIGAVSVIFALAMILLIVVRVLAKASPAILITTIIAFLLWMVVLDKGLFNIAYPDLLPDPMGLILAVFYSTLITVLASAGIIK